MRYVTQRTSGYPDWVSETKFVPDTAHVRKHRVSQFKTTRRQGKPWLRSSEEPVFQRLPGPMAADLSRNRETSLLRDSTRPCRQEFASAAATPIVQCNFGAESLPGHEKEFGALRAVASWQLRESQTYHREKRVHTGRSVTYLYDSPRNR